MRIIVQTNPGKKQDPISKIYRAKRAGSVVQGVEHLPSKCETLSSTPVPQKEKKKFYESLKIPFLILDYKTKLGFRDAQLTKR
jgi:hypothetical protein